LFEKYYPLEVSIDLSFEEKFKMCEEWWGQVCSSLVVNALQSSRRAAVRFLKRTCRRRSALLCIPFNPIQAHELLLEYKVNKSDIEHMVNEAELTLRDGVDAFFKLLEQHHVPCLVFSAGIADVIEEVLYLVYYVLSSTTARPAQICLQ
jgi:5'-nucleotidase